MPLSIFERDDNGRILKTSANEEKFRPLPLQGEIRDEDFCAPMSEIGTFGLRHAWLKANFDQNMLWVPEDIALDTFKQELAGFLNENMNGPYYVMQGYVNTRWTLSVIIMDPDDIETFRKQYPQWEFKDKAADENAQTLAKWQEESRELSDPALYKYAAPQA